MTQILEIKDLNTDKEKILTAAKMLKNGGTVVFPTETVYGLGANALDEQAVTKIFEAKGRPSDNPLIVHIYDIRQVKELAGQIPVNLHILAEEFWPGPLTLVMKKSDRIPQIVSAGLDTVGIRMPDNPIALALLKHANVPVAAPSANISGSPSPTSAGHVIMDLHGRIDTIIDGGNCRVGLESTVLDISGEIPVILRPGAITLEQLKKVLGDVLVDKHVNMKVEERTGKPKSPGVKYKHYAPDAEGVVFEGPVERVVEEIKARMEMLQGKGKKVGIMATEQTKRLYDKGVVLSSGDRNNPETIAANLFEVLRKFDEAGVDVILMEAVDIKGVGMAIMNRMIRAAGYNIIMLD